MILLTFNEWIGPGRDSEDRLMPVVQRVVSMVSHMTLYDALSKVKAYQESYNKHFYPHAALNFTLTGMNTDFPGFGQTTLRMMDEMGVGLVEDLRMYPDEEYAKSLVR